MMTEMKKQTEKGFTLIELMIVVAIIGILAAIAIPQFASYRVKAFNSAAQSDIRTLKLTQEAYYADFQNYGVTGAAAAGGALVTGGTPGVLGDGTNATAAVSPSTKVTVTSYGDALVATTMIIEAAHQSGNRVFAMDSDSTALYYAGKDEGKVLISSAFTPVVTTDQVIGGTPGTPNVAANTPAKFTAL